MNVCYYDKQIKEELDGARDYIQRAINCKKDHPDYAKAFSDMASMELSHAKNLVWMFEDEMSKETSKMETVAPIYGQVHDEILSSYSDGLAKVKVMQEIFASK